MYKSAFTLLLKKRELLRTAAAMVSKKENCKYAVAKRKIIHDSFVFGSTYSEYIMYDFFNRTDMNKDTFATTLWLLEIMKKYNPVKAREVFHDKVQFNNKFKKYLGRDYLVISESSKEMLIEFVRKYNKVVLKGSHGCSGKQVKVLNTSDPSIWHFIDSGDYDLIEQFVTNHERIAALNPTSLNTLRIVTIHSEKECNIIFAGIRIGAIGAQLDNVSQGGCCASVDKNTGEITSRFIQDATCEKEGTQRGRNEIGYQLPFWQETITMIKEASKIVPDIHIVGWDAAITQDGPILIEGNESFGAYIMQYYAGLEEPGVKKEMLDALNNI